MATQRAAEVLSDVRVTGEQAQGENKGEGGPCTGPAGGGGGGRGGPAPQRKAGEREGWGCTDMLWGSVLTLGEQKTAPAQPGAATEVGPGAAGAKAGFV